MKSHAFMMHVNTTHSNRGFLKKRLSFEADADISSADLNILDFRQSVISLLLSSDETMAGTGRTEWVATKPILTYFNAH